ncbi:MAG TPA: hypothetical protein VMX55_04985 [candidate division Zixibacteria bacterium]|nr:hypothetical protein [candidate division Zixibacteria bacterium]
MPNRMFIVEKDGRTKPKLLFSGALPDHLSGILFLLQFNAFQKLHNWETINR